MKERVRLIEIFTGLMILVFCIMFSNPFPVRAANVLRIGIGADADTLNPQESTTATIQNILEFIYDRLYYQNEKAENVPMLVTGKSVSEDGLSWTFKLRKGVRFHDGTPFNAEVMKVNLDRLLDPKTRAPLRFYVGMIDSYDVVDDYTFRVHLKYPYGMLESIFSHTVTCPMSKKAIEESGDLLSTHPVGTGPFKFGEWIKGERIVLVRNDDYYGRKPTLEKIIFRIIPEHATRTAMLRAGDLDMIELPQPPDVPALKSDPDLKVISKPSSRLMFIGFNNQKEILKDKRVRQALNYAVDKETIVKKIMFDTANVLEGPMPAGYFGYYKCGRYAYNPKKAKELLKAANFPMEKTISMITPTGRYAFDKQVAEAVQAYLNDIGLKVELRTYDWPTYNSITRKPVDQNETELFLMGWRNPILDPDILYMAAFHSSAWAPRGMNTLFYKNKEVDRLIEKARISQSPSERKQLYKKTSMILWDDAPMLFLYEPQYIIVYRKNVKGIKVYPMEKFDPVYATVD
jgi:peptide/nickel transport system substrate-binding protein